MNRHVILFLAANPSGTSRLALDEECAAIERELRMTTGRDDFDFRSKWAVSIDEMMRHLNELQPTVIHFSGHGGGSAGIYVQDAQPQPPPVYRDIGAATGPGIQLQDEQRQPQHVITSPCRASNYTAHEECCEAPMDNARVPAFVVWRHAPATTVELLAARCLALVSFP
jgi:hypothetical protein